MKQTCGRGSNSVVLRCVSNGGRDNACCPERPATRNGTCNAQPCDLPKSGYDLIFAVPDNSTSTSPTTSSESQSQTPIQCVTVLSQFLVGMSECDGSDAQLWTQIDDTAVAGGNQRQWVSYLTGRCLKAPRYYSDTQVDANVVTLGDCALGDEYQDFYADQLVDTQVCVCVYGVCLCCFVRFCACVVLWVGA